MPETREAMLARMKALRDKRKERRAQAIEGFKAESPKAKPVKAEETKQFDRSAEETIPPNLFGEQKSLEVMGRNGSVDDPIPGFRLRWFTDLAANGARVKLAERCGWRLVDREEVFVNDAVLGGNDDVGSHVRKLANIYSAGREPPIYKYLMKLPLHIQEGHDKAYEEQLRRLEDQIIAGRKSSNPDHKQYAPGEIPGSQLPKITIGSGIYRPKT